MWIAADEVALNVRYYLDDDDLSKKCCRLDVCQEESDSVIDFSFADRTPTFVPLYVFPAGLSL